MVSAKLAASKCKAKISNAMRILLGHTLPPRPDYGEAWVNAWLARLRMAGFDVHPFSLVLNEKRGIAYWSELDSLWRTGDRNLCELYNRLGERLRDFDVFICYNGANVHPGILESFPTFNVYACFDDPENTEHLSRPVAAAFDMALVGNLAELDRYRNWGVKFVHHWPHGFRFDDFDPALTRADILSGSRDVDVTLLCERVAPWRRERVDRFAARFPQGAYYGPGWPSGFLPEPARVPLLQRTKIGINIHNSTGPINFRTFYLPANGVMQICDNKSYLGGLFELGKEIAGYDTIEEAIELTRYYLDHDNERREIAARGFERAHRDYNEVAAFRRIADAIASRRYSKTPPGTAVPEFLARHRRNTLVPRLATLAAAPLTIPLRQLKRIAAAGRRRLARKYSNLTLRAALSRKK